jgi:hypothetical protein
MSKRISRRKYSRKKYSNKNLRKRSKRYNKSKTKRLNKKRISRKKISRKRISRKRYSKRYSKNLKKYKGGADRNCKCNEDDESVKPTISNTAEAAEASSPPTQSLIDDYYNQFNNITNSFYTVLPPVVRSSSIENIFWEPKENGSDGNCFYYTIFDGLIELKLFENFLNKAELKNSELKKYGEGMSRKVNTESLRRKIYNYAGKSGKLDQFCNGDVKNCRHLNDFDWAEDNQIEITINYLNSIGIKICLLMFDLSMKNWVLFRPNETERIKVYDIYDKKSYNEFIYRPNVTDLKEGIPGGIYDSHQIKNSIELEKTGTEEFLEKIKRCDNMIYANNITGVHFYYLKKIDARKFNKKEHQDVFNDSGYR